MLKEQSNSTVSHKIVESMEENNILLASLNPLKLATQKSLEHIKNKKKAYELLLLLSCFPHGIQKSYVIKLLENEKDIDESIKILHKYAFLKLKDIEDLEQVRDEDTLMLTNFLQTYLKLK